MPKRARRWGPTVRVTCARGFLVAVGFVSGGVVTVTGSGAAGAATRGAGSCSVAKVLSGWSIQRRAAQLIAVPVAETAVGTIRLSVAHGAGGVVLFGSAGPANLGSALAALRAAAPGDIAPIVMDDEEGGGVQRLANLVGSMPWPRTMAATTTPAAVQALVTSVARRMAALGVTMDLAPVLDLASGPGPDATHTDGPRSFSPVASVATRYGLAFMRGLIAGGVIPVIKHFPGEGSATANTDLAPASTPPLTVLQKADLLPFGAAIRAGAPVVMVGNASVPGLTTLPASLSSAAMGGLLRGQLGFRGLIVTDSLSAIAISARHLSVPAAAAASIAAGADMVLYNTANPNTVFTETVAAITAAVRAGRISVATLNADVAMVLSTKGVALCKSA
jgi:beta-N-acetylhexosaminidase